MSAQCLVLISTLQISRHGSLCQKESRHSELLSIMLSGNKKKKENWTKKTVS